MSSKKYRKYIKYLESDEWKEKRLQVAKLKNYKCEKCGKEVKFGYHIHHLTYERLFNEELSDLMFLCADCHANIHGKPLNTIKKENKPKKPIDNSLYARIMKSKKLKARVNIALNSKKEEQKIFVKYFNMFLKEIKPKK